MASKLRVSDESIELRKSLVALYGPCGAGANIVDSWRVNFIPPEWLETVEVTVAYEDAHWRLRIQKRQPHEQPMSLLHGFLHFNEKCVVPTDDGRLIDEEI
jgi:hypothetical protein